MRMMRCARGIAGLTLLELLIVIAAVAVILFIALPTLKPTEEEVTIEFVKEQLRYLHAKEQQYFSRYGKYVPLSTLAADEQIGRVFDQRFAEDTCIVEGVVFKGPTGESTIYDIVAELPDGTRYKVDQTGVVKRL
jgi:type II secretory pathway pseudopilin PulG